MTPALPDLIRAAIRSDGRTVYAIAKAAGLHMLGRCRDARHPGTQRQAIDCRCQQLDWCTLITTNTTTSRDRHRHNSRNPNDETI